MKGVRHLATATALCLGCSSIGQTGRNAFNSLVIIDTNGTGFHFTDPTRGEYVSFDLKGDGKLMKVSWPKAGSGNMWLVLVEPSGTVTNGQQLFGNNSPHSDADLPNYPKPNGFNALNWWDRPQQGGAGHLIIGSQDKVYAGLPDGRRLMLWDASDCLKERDTACVSKPGELHALSSKGIRSISGVWGGVSADNIPKGTPLLVKNGWQQYGSVGGIEDIVGNQYVFYTLLNPDVADEPVNALGEEVNAKGESCCDEHQKSHDGRWAIDVYLKSIQ